MEQNGLYRVHSLTMESARYLCLSLATQQNHTPHTHSHRRCHSWGYKTRRLCLLHSTLTVPDTLDRITQSIPRYRGVRPACAMLPLQTTGSGTASTSVSVSDATLSKPTPGFEICRAVLGFHSELFPPPQRIHTAQHLNNACLHLHTHTPGNQNSLRNRGRGTQHTGTG